MSPSFLGYRRADTRCGTRNYLAVISSVGCANELTRRIAGDLPLARAIAHDQGCAQLTPDIQQVERTLAGIARNPNVGAVVVVSLGCESVSAAAIAAAAREAGRPVETVCLQEQGGFGNALAAGLAAAHRMSLALAGQEREQVPASELVVGIKCGASDATSGLLANPVCGTASDLVVAAGGTSIFCETTEFMGAEDILCARAADAGVAQRIRDIVRRVESDVQRTGFDMRGGQPSPGNMAGGITTIEEKSLGAVCKGGTATIRGVLEYGSPPPGRGLYIMDSPGREMEVLSGLAAAGANVILFTTGRGAPQGFPIVPVVKISANPHTCERLAEHIDCPVLGLLEGTADVAGAGQRLYSLIARVASGRLTRAEVCGYTETLNIWVRGPVI